jgi:rhodanese-related sulfurtransferase
MKTGARILAKEVAAIVLISALLALVYNATSRKGLPLIRKEVKKVAVTDSALFPTVTGIQSASLPAGDSSTLNIPVIAPLHEKALRNPDSMAQLYGNREEHVMRVINLMQFKRLLGENRAIVIDARDKESFAGGHILSAWNIPGLEVDQYFERFVTLPRDTLILIYCNNPECHLSRIVGDFLQVMGFSNMYHYDGGWDEWSKAKK